MDEVFIKAECNGIPTCYSNQKLQNAHCKTNQGLRALSFVGQSLWNNLDKPLKTSAYLIYNQYNQHKERNNEHNTINIYSQ